MRIGLDLRAVGDAAARRDLAEEADRLGIWAVMLGGVAGTEVAEASSIATSTENIHLAVWVEGSSEHPLTIAEEVSVLDHLSKRRALAIIDGSPEVANHIDRLLSGQIVDGVALAPPPAQTCVPVWIAEQVATLELTGDLTVDRATIDAKRDSGCTHLFVTWPGPLSTLARHLATRSLTPDFPQLVADLADKIDPTSAF